MDGTLVDSIHGTTLGLLETFREFGNDAITYEDVRVTIGTPLVQQMKLGIRPDLDDETLNQAIEFALSRYAVHHQDLHLFEPAVEALRRCHQEGLKVALITSKNATEIQIFSPLFPAMDCVDIIVCASDVQEPKPHPESMFQACRRLGVEPQDAFMVGDSIYDLQSANGAGVMPIAVAYGSMPKTVLLEENPAECFDTPAELLEWTQNQFFAHHEKENEFITH